MNDTDHIDFTPWNNPPKMYADIEEFSFCDLGPHGFKTKSGYSSAWQAYLTGRVSQNVVPKANNNLSMPWKVMHLGVDDTLLLGKIILKWR